MHDSGLPPTVAGWRRILYLLLAGMVSLLALLGAFLPVIPTTPFLLLASFLLVRSSPRLNRALLASRLFGPMLKDWQQHRGVRRHVKVQAITSVTLVVGLTLYFAQWSWPWSAAVVALALCGVLVVLRLPEVRD